MPSVKHSRPEEDLGSPLESFVAALDLWSFLHEKIRPHLVSEFVCAFSLRVSLVREPARVVKSPLVEHWHRESELFVVV